MKYCTIRRLYEGLFDDIDFTGDEDTILDRIVENNRFIISSYSKDDMLDLIFKYYNGDKAVEELLSGKPSVSLYVTTDNTAYKSIVSFIEKYNINLITTNAGEYFIKTNKVRYENISIKV